MVEQSKKTKFFKKKPHHVAHFGLYHYVYGVDTSSSACVAAYVTDCINQHTTNGSLGLQGQASTANLSLSTQATSQGKGSSSADESKIIEKVIKGVFCIYDIVTKRDVRVEVQIPGGTQVYALEHGSDVQREIMGILEWNNVFMSSVLRSLEAPKLPCPVMRVVRELKTPESFQDFLQVAQNIF